MGHAAPPIPIEGDFIPLHRDICWVNILVYHGLSHEAALQKARPLDITPRQCLAEIRWLESLGYRLISAQDLEELSCRPRSGAHLLICFDDAHLGTFESLLGWLKDEQIPVLLAVCPGVVDDHGSGDGIYWWEEARARFAATTHDILTFDSEGASWRCRRLDVDDFEGRCLVDATRRRRLMSQLRTQTEDVSPAEVRRSPYVHRNMGWSELVALNRHDGCTIAAHSMFHDTANSWPADVLRNDALACRRLLQEHLGCASPHFVYPNGAHDDTTDQVLASCGFEFTYSVIGAVNRLDQGTQGPFHRFHGFGYDPDEHAAYVRQFNARHLSRRRTS